MRSLWPLALLTVLSCTDTDPGGDTDPVALPGLDERPANRTCAPPEGPPVLEEAFPDLPRLTKPVLLTQAPGDGAWWYVALQGGDIYRFPADPSASELTPVGSLSDRVSAGYERGLLGLAFHPDFQSNGQVVLSYTRGNGNSRIIRVGTSEGGARFDIPGSLDDEDLILEIEQPYSNHNGGHVLFGPDGYLYFGAGDGGSGGDPQGNGQNTDTLLGAMLRLDIDGGSPYAIPPDNPFASGGGAPEIFAWGLRNPWRFSFDRETGELWAGDVGQNAWEEIDRIELGKNYGWKIMEGEECYGPAGCDQTGLELPIVTYGHNLGGSVTGGYVYRGERVRSLYGRYLFADFVSGRIWGVFEDEEGHPQRQIIVNTETNPSTFAEDHDGELYIVDYYEGRVLAFDVGSGGGALPATLSETGCVDPDDPTVLAEGLIPYAVNVPLWSDGLQKRRWFALPDGESLQVDDDGDVLFPAGSVLVKEFSHAGRRVETRLLFHHESGSWSGAAYVWNAEETEAVLQEERAFVDLDGQEWMIPGSADCLQCHTAAANRALGLEVGQLDGSLLYPRTGRTANQLFTLSHVGLLPEQLPESPAFSAQDARAYLHSNCSMCHQEGAGGGGSLDLRIHASLAEMNACGVAPELDDLGIAGALLVAPGDPDTSILSVRMHATGDGRMPPLGSALVDPDGTGLVDGWISNLSSCE